VARQEGRLAAIGIDQMIKLGGGAVGLPDLHPHQLRRTFSHDWLASGASKGDPMRLADWKWKLRLTRSAASAAYEHARHTSRCHSPETTSDRTPTLSEVCIRS
jgi:integrase